jgi:rhamnogalacturonyl hydrolase YesR
VPSLRTCSLALFAAAGLALAVAAPPRCTRSAEAVRGQASPLAAAERVARRELADLDGSGLDSRDRDTSPGPDGSLDPRGWQQAVFWIGMTALADHGAPWAREAILAHGRTAAWALGERPYHADDQAIGGAYLWAAGHGAGPEAVAPLRARFDGILSDPPKVRLAFYFRPQGAGATVDCLQRWCWSDALFMAPPVWLELSRRTGDRRYRDFALAEFWACTDFLYDPAERLYFRDSRFFAVRDDRGRKIFWSRGDGWVFAALPRMLEALPPDDPQRPRLARLFQDMAARLKTLQGPDGYWPSSLLAPLGAPPESSGTALYTYGFAWGVRHGLLPRAEYESVARKGWAALERALRPDGRLGWAQPPGDQPGPSAASDSQVYAAGAFLLAATAVADLDRPD